MVDYIVYVRCHSRFDYGLLRIVYSGCACCPLEFVVWPRKIGLTCMVGDWCGHKVRPLGSPREIYWFGWQGRDSLLLASR